MPGVKQPEEETEKPRGDYTARCFFDSAEMRVLLCMFGPSLA